jgi:iron complex transport system substrate-binding protein
VSGPLAPLSFEVPSVDPLARSIRRRGAALATFAVLLASCAGAPTLSAPPSSTGASAAVASGVASPSPSTSAATPGATVTFPLTLTDDEGGTVALPAPPQKIASLTPAVTETLFRLGAGDRAVGRVDDPFLYPPEAKDVPIVAKAGSVDVEKIVSLGADLVIAGGNGFNPPDAIAKLRSLKVPVLVVYASDVDGVFKDIELIGDSIGEPSPARDLTASMRAGFDQVSAATGSLPHPRTFYEIDATKEIFGPAKGSFLESMVRLAGGDPVTTGSTTAFSIPLERLVAADPELILLGDAAYGTKVSDVTKRPGWGAMTAVKTGAIRPVDDVVISRPGPRLLEGLRSLATAIHPDLVLAPAPSGGSAGGAASLAASPASSSPPASAGPASPSPVPTY